MVCACVVTVELLVILIYSPHYAGHYGFLEGKAKYDGFSAGLRDKLGSGIRQRTDLRDSPVVDGLETEETFYNAVENLES